jgi:hypothetical protein
VEGDLNAPSVGFMDAIRIDMSFSSLLIISPQIVG